MKTSPYLNIKRIEIVVTNRCNGQCLHCSAAENSHMLSRACIDANETAKVIQTLTQMFRVQSVMTFGGEPLLFPAAACTVHRAATDSGVPVRQVITNGCFAKDSAYLAKTAKQLQAAGGKRTLRHTALHRAAGQSADPFPDAAGRSDGLRLCDR